MSAGLDMKLRSYHLDLGPFSSFGAIALQGGVFAPLAVVGRGEHDLRSHGQPTVDIVGCRESQEETFSRSSARLRLNTE